MRKDAKEERALRAMCEPGTDGSEGGHEKSETTAMMLASPHSVPMPTNKKKKGQKKTMTAEDLAQAAEHAMNVQDPLQAILLYSKALELPDADRSSLLAQRAEVKVSISDQEGACQDFQAALEHLNEDDDAAQIASLNLYIGQLSEGTSALDCYQKGIQALHRSMEIEQSGDSNPDETRKQLAAAYCNVAELYMTDLCFDDNAEQECESHIAQALKLVDAQGKPVVDALQSIASLRLSQSRGIEAVDYILQAYEQMRVGCEALATLVGLRESSEPNTAAELLELDCVQNLPGFEFRCQTGKILLECVEQLKQRQDERASPCCEAAVCVVGSLLAENDEVVEIWQLTGDVFASMEPPVADAAIHHWERAVEMLRAVKKSLDNEALEVEDDDEVQCQIDEVVCHLEELQSKISDMKADQARDETTMTE